MFGKYYFPTIILKVVGMMQGMNITNVL